MAMANPKQAWNLLLVDDDLHLCRGLSQFLRQLGHRVVVCSTGNSATQAAMSEDFDAIILDLILPEFSGIQFLSLIRNIKNTPVIMISSMTEVDYRLAALQAGVDDFMVKPISHQEILERIKAILRRTKASEAEPICIGNVEIDLAKKMVKMEGKLVLLTISEFEVLALLAKNRGTVLARQELQNALSDPDHKEYSNIIDQYIMRIRRKLGKELITTRVGFGYMLHG